MEPTRGPVGGIFHKATPANSATYTGQHAPKLRRIALLDDEIILARHYREERREMTASEVVGREPWQQ